MQHGEAPRGLKDKQHLHPYEGADHEDLAVGKVDELEDAIDHGVAQGNQGVHETQDDPIYEHGEKYTQREIQCGVL